MRFPIQRRQVFQGIGLALGATWLTGLGQPRRLEAREPKAYPATRSLSKQPDESVSIYPVFMVKAGQEEALRKTLRAIIERSKGEPKTLVFTMAFDGNKLMLKESYTSVDGFRAHLANVSDLVSDFFAALEPVSLNIVLPLAELPAMEKLLKELKMTANLFTIEAGYSA